MKNTIFKNGKVAINGKLHALDILVSNGKIVDISEEISVADAEIIDCENLKILSGLIDIHTHGGFGFDVNAVSVEDIDRVSLGFAKHGVTGFYATILTDTKENLLVQLAVLGEACAKTQSGAKLLGINMEGPYLSETFRGAMPLECLQNPSISDFSLFQEAANGNVKIMTLSPELDGTTEFVEAVSKTGVVCSIGHSGADYATANKAIEAGVNLATHTFNAMRPYHHKEPGILGSVFDADIYCELICDGLHVHPSNMRTLLKIKGLDKIVAITDCISGTGMPDGENYVLGNNHNIVVKDGNAWMPDFSCRAGSTLTSEIGLKRLSEITANPIEVLVKAFSENQANLLGISDEKGSISVGKDADFTFWNENDELKFTSVCGQLIYPQIAKRQS